MEPVCAGFGRKDGLQSGGATVFARKRVDLNTGFLNCIRLRSQVQNALANSAGDVQAINNVLIVVLALAVGAGVNLRFGREVVHAGSRAPRRTRSQPGDTRS